MKNATKLLIAVAALIALATPALAANFWVDHFNYPNGGLVTSSLNVWKTHSGTGTDIQVVSGVARGDMAQGPDDNRTFPTRTATDKTYACFAFQLPSTGGLVANYFAHFKDTGTNFRSKVFTIPTGTGLTWTLGVSVAANAASTPPYLNGVTGVYWPTNLNTGQWYRVVISYDAALGISEMWVDPSSESSPKVVAADTSAAGVFKGTPLSGFALRQSNTNGSAYGWWVDDVGVGTSFEDACVETPVATLPTTWGQLKHIYR